MNIYIDNYREMEEGFEKKFPDPMTQKHGGGFKLYCSFCLGQDAIKEYLRTSYRTQLEKLREHFERELVDEHPVDCIDGETPVETYGYEKEHNFVTKFEINLISEALKVI